MRMWQTVEKNCPSCHGRGEVWTGEYRDDGYWTMAVQCHCVQYHHDDEMKGFLKGITALSSALREGEK